MPRPSNCHSLRFLPDDLTGLPLSSQQHFQCRKFGDYEGNRHLVNRIIFNVIGLVIQPACVQSKRESSTWTGSVQTSLAGHKRQPQMVGRVRQRPTIPGVERVVCSFPVRISNRLTRKCTTAYDSDLWPRRRLQSLYSIPPASRNPPRLFENCSNVQRNCR